MWKPDDIRKFYTLPYPIILIRKTSKHIIKERKRNHAIAYWRYLGTLKCKIPPPPQHSVRCPRQEGISKLSKKTKIAVLFYGWSNKETLFPEVLEGGQTRKHSFLTMFPEGWRTKKYCFLAIFRLDSWSSIHQSCKAICYT